MRHLRYQYEYAGTQLINLRLLVCPDTCLDIPQPQLKARVVEADPYPVRDPRTQDFAAAEGTGVFVSLSGASAPGEPGEPLTIE